MDKRRVKLDWWVASLAAGLFFGVGRAGLELALGPRTLANVLGHLVGGFVFGAIMGPIWLRLQRRTEKALGPLPRPQARAATRAAMRGPVPDDPEVRRAAGRLAESQRSQTLQYRWIVTAGTGLFIAICLVLAVTWSPWLLMPIAPLVLLLAYAYWLPTHLESRIALLGDPVEH